MINNISNQDLLNNSIKDKLDLVKVSGEKTGKTTNPYAKTNLYLIDKTDISDNAISLYEKDLDVKKFTNLVLSDENDLSHNELFETNVISKLNNISDEELSETLINNKDFLKTLFG